MVINFILDMLREESDLLKENKRENTGVRRHNGNSLLSKKEKKKFVILDISTRDV